MRQGCSEGRAGRPGGPGARLSGRCQRHEVGVVDAVYQRLALRGRFLASTSSCWQGVIQQCLTRALVPAAFLVLLGTLAVPSARAATAPQIDTVWATQVVAKTARLHGELTLDPAESTDYHFDYI